MNFEFGEPTNLTKNHVVLCTIFVFVGQNLYAMPVKKKKQKPNNNSPWLPHVKGRYIERSWTEQLILGGTTWEALVVLLFTFFISCVVARVGKVGGCRV